jgi:hypothetical protein
MITVAITALCKGLLWGEGGVCGEDLHNSLHPSFIKRVPLRPLAPEVRGTG